MDDRLAAVAAAQGGVFTTGQARATHTQEEIRRFLQAGTWLRVRRGVYVDAAAIGTSEVGNDDGGPCPHRLRAAAAVLVTRGDVVVSHASAARLHDLPIAATPGTPTLTLVRPPGAPPAHPDGVHPAAVPAEHRTTVQGVPVTTRARTVADLLRGADDYPHAVALADAALRHGVGRAAAREVLASSAHWPGVRKAVQALDFGDGRAESPLESRCRVWFHRQQLPAPTPQVKVLDPRGQLIARVDFLFREQRTVCEADGRLKYLDPAVLWREKRREDDLREQGLEVVRATWADGDDAGRGLAERLRRAFARAAARPW